MKISGSRKLRIEKLFALAALVMGIVLLIFMITVEDEPGAIPLLFIVIGAGWYFFTRIRILSNAP